MPASFHATLGPVLAIDPGTERLGWAVATMERGKKRALGAGVVTMDTRNSLGARLLQVHGAIETLLDSYRPKSFAVEEVFYAKFPNATIKLGHVRGVVMLCAAARGLVIAEYAPTEIKKAVTGSGRASKGQVAGMIAHHFGLATALPADASDALALALTHLIARPTVTTPGRT